MSSTGNEDGTAGGGIIPSIWRTLGKAAEVPIGGIVAFSVVSSAAITFLSFRNKEKQGWEEPSPSSSSSLSSSSSITQKLEDGKECGVCKGKGFYLCKLCKGNATIEWSPLYDPVFINPCVCPTCDGNRIQRCLNCLGKGILSGG